MPLRNRFSVRWKKPDGARLRELKIPRSRWYNKGRFTEVFTAFHWGITPDQFDAKSEITRAEMIEFLSEFNAMQAYEQKEASK